MEHGKTREEIINQSLQKTEEGKEELYQYSLQHIEKDKPVEGRRHRNALYDLKTFFYLCGELIRENPQDYFGVIVMDIAQFKAVNEFCGRSEGDRLLKFISSSFRYYEDNRPKTYACHLRADNFCLCTAYEKESELEEIAMDLRSRIDEFPFTYRVLPAFGICASRDKRPSVSYLKDCATIAMQSIKGKFYAEYAVFDDEMRRSILREKQIENDIVAALKNGELTAFIQPKVNMRTGKIVGGEALVRWIHPDRGVISPAEFIPILEKNGFIINVDQYIWEKVFAFLGEMNKEGRPLVPVSINVSRIHAYDKRLCESLIEMSKKYDVPPQYTPLELTESAFLRDEDGIFERMKLLQAKGFKISMDDFGTGCSTMNMLKSQPLDEIKIDRCFILNLKDGKSQVILKHTIAMLQAMGSKIVMEGVETEEQRDVLLHYDCEEAQGFMFYKPMPMEEFDALLRKQESL